MRGLLRKFTPQSVAAAVLRGVADRISAAAPRSGAAPHATSYVISCPDYITSYVCHDICCDMSLNVFGDNSALQWSRIHLLFLAVKQNNFY